MRAFAKSIVISILVTIAILLFTNLIFFFPWYTNLIIETFNLTQITASDNYIKQNDYDKALDELKKRPIYKKNPDKVKITVKNADDKSAIGFDHVERYVTEGYTDDNKPYRQRGKPVKVTVEAVYPLSIKLWGKEYTKNIDVSFTLTSTGLKHYKDLQYYEYLPEKDLEP